MEGRKEKKEFYRCFLRSMDPERAARECGVDNPYEALGSLMNRRRLEQAREYVGREIRREDVIRRLAQLAFGESGDAVRLAMLGQTDEKTLEGMDFSAVAEIRRSPNGGLEIKMLDRIRVLSTLYELLSGGEEPDLESFFHSLEQTGKEEQN